MGFAQAFLTGAAQGTVDALDKQRKQGIEDAENSRRMEAQDIQLRAAKRNEADNIALRSAVTPMQDGAGQVAAPITADNRDIGQADGPTLANGQLTQGTAAQANAPGAQVDRQAQILTSQGKAGDAIKLKTESAALTRSQEERLRTIQQEGYADTARAMQIGDPQAVAEAFNKQGKTKIKGDLKVESVERDVPGLGKVPTFNYTGTLVGPDGTERQGTINSHDFAMSLFPYKDKLELGIKGAEAGSKQELRLSQAETGAARADAAGARAQASQTLAEAAAERARSANNPDGVKAIAEQRKQATALMADSTKNLSEVRKKMNELRRGAPLGIKPGTPEYEEMQGYQDEAAKHQANYDEARAQLSAVGKPGGGAAPAAAPAAAPTAIPAKRPNIASVQGAPKGASIGKLDKRGWEVLDPTGKLVGYAKN